MFGQRSVAGFAVHMRVLAFAFHIEHVTVAGLASLMTGELHRSSCDLADCVAAIMSIPAKAWWNHEMSNNKKDNKSENEESRESEEMPGILESAHCSPIS